MSNALKASGPQLFTDSFRKSCIALRVMGCVLASQAETVLLCLESWDGDSRLAQSRPH